MSVFDTLKQRNAQFSEQRFIAGLPLLPQPRTLILGCVDPRVDPAHILGIDLGEAAIIRNVGGRLTPTVFSEIALLGKLTTIISQGQVARGELIVLQHTDCGITRLQDPPEMLAGFFGIDTSELRDKHVADPHLAVQQDVATLRANPRIDESFRISGVVYDVTTGRIELVTKPEDDEDGT